MIPRPMVVVTRTNARHLRLLAGLPLAAELGEELRALYRKLDVAITVDDERVPRGVVTLGSTVLYYEPRGETEHRAVLTFPWDAAPAAGRISVVSPLGIALLGSRIGMSLRFRATSDKSVTSRIDVLDVLFQPEFNVVESR